MKKYILFLFLIFIIVDVKAQQFDMKSVLSYPFPSELVASNTGSKIAWAVNEQGKRNIYVAEAPSFKAVKITNYTEDDGQELTSVSISQDGNWVVFVRGGDHSARDAGPVNASSNPNGAEIEVYSVPFNGGKINLLAEGDNPVVSPKNDQVLFSKSGQIFIVGIDGLAKAKKLFSAKGTHSSYKWSPDGSKIVFVSNRTDHSFIGVFTDSKTPIQWLEPGFGFDNSPVWAPDGKSVSFIRTPGSAGAVDSILNKKHLPWAIWVANLSTSKGKQIWKAPETLRGSFPSVGGGANLNWADDKIVFISYEDGWPHLYSINPDGSNKLLLTPGAFGVENLKISPDLKYAVFAANTGDLKDDLDRRHIYRVSVNKADRKALSSGTGIESYPVVLSDNSTVISLSSNAQQPLMPAILTSNKNLQIIGEELIPKDFPTSQMVTPTHVQFKSADGVTVYGQLFTPKNPKKNAPAIVFIHGGPQRQMMLGWSPMDYYSANYAVNQYLVSLGFTVLSVNYRLGIGYGYEFHKPDNAGAQGASEYQDIKAAGEWLATQKGIDGNKIGTYGGSYGGYLVGLALGKDSKLFKAGVNIHGVNNRFNSAAEMKSEAPDADLAADLAKKSAPVNYIDTWTSPTLIIHADDDRNVGFIHSVNLARRLEDKKQAFEYLSIPDDTHHWMKFSNLVKVSEATTEFLNRILNQKE
jgi:dipeptidyl aminopeptidase/acylaminoacyl peptidase